MGAPLKPWRSDEFKGIMCLKGSARQLDVVSIQRDCKHLMESVITLTEVSRSPLPPRFSLRRFPSRSFVRRVVRSFSFWQAKSVRHCAANSRIVLRPGSF